MPDQTMIERVARALLREKLTRDGHRAGPAIDTAVDHEWSKFADYARIALTVLREPTDRMVEDAWLSLPEVLLDQWHGRDIMKDAYKAAIDAALEDGR